MAFCQAHLVVWLARAAFNFFYDIVAARRDVSTRRRLYSNLSM